MKGIRNELLEPVFNNYSKNAQKTVKLLAINQASEIAGKEKVNNREMQFLRAMVVNVHIRQFPLTVSLGNKSVTILPSSYYRQLKYRK